MKGWIEVTNRCTGLKVDIQIINIVLISDFSEYSSACLSEIEKVVIFALSGNRIEVKESREQIKKLIEEAQ